MMDARTKDGPDAPRLRRLLTDLYNYYRMDSSADAILLFEQLCFVLAQMREQRYSAEAPKDTREGLDRYVLLVSAFAHTELGARAAPVLPELEGRPELVLRLMRTAWELLECARRQTARLGPVLSGFLEELFQFRNSGIVCTPLDTARELVGLLRPEEPPEYPLSVMDIKAPRLIQFNYSSADFAA